MPRYTPDNTRGRMVRTFLDGEEVRDVIEVDDDLGFVIVLDRMQTSRRRLMTGNVIVTFPEEAGASQA